MQRQIAADDDLAYLQQIRQRILDVPLKIQPKIWRQQLREAEAAGSSRLAGLVRLQLARLSEVDAGLEPGQGLLHPSIFRDTSLGLAALERIREELNRHPDRFPALWGIVKRRDLLDPLLSLAHEDFFDRAMERKDDVTAGDIVAWSLHRPEVSPHWRSWAEARLAHHQGKRPLALEKLSVCLRTEEWTTWWLRAESLGREILKQNPLEYFLSIDDARRIGAGFLAQNRDATAWRCFQAVLSRQKKLPATDPIWFQAGLVNRRLGHFSVALRYLRRFQTDKMPRKIESLSLQAMCLHRLGRTADFESLIARLRRLDPAHAEYLHLLQAVAYDAELTGDNAKIEEYYREIMARYPETLRGTEACWKLAWQAYRTGDFNAAAELFLKTVRQDRGLDYAVAALYWYGVVQLRRNEQENGRGALECVAGLFPYGYYASLARVRLADLAGEYDAALAARVAGEWQSLLLSRRSDRPMPPLEHWSLVMDAAILRPVAEAYVCGFPKHAYRALVELEKQVAAPLRSGYYESRAILAGHADDTAAVIADFNQAHPEWSQVSLDQFPRDIWEMIFPRKYLTVIEKQVTGDNMDPLLILALIRQESAFREDARSSANALGLMQLLTRTAAAEMRFRGSRRRMAVKLLDPDYNIQAGCRHLSGLLRTFEGRIPLALAAYNGGTRRVKTTFQRNESDLGLAEIIELIPMSQTRNYVKYVLRNYNYYCLLYREKAADFAELFSE
ncbi:MAG: transglycosylase SLT domain-containing protein [Acidobacteria bacterium]|nr:transglycosylase SLT domain-containing protein [Acidobacteriota bacterium]